MGTFCFKMAKRPLTHGKLDIFKSVFFKPTNLKTKPVS